MASKKEKLIKAKILLLLFISILSMLFFSSFINAKFVFFAPFIIFLFFHLNFVSILWISTLLGLFQDLFSSSFFGIHAICYLLVSLILFREKRFFNEKPINLSIFTTIFSVLYSVINPFLFFIFDKKINLSIKWIITDLVIFPAFDGIYAFLFFALPILCFETIRKIGIKSLWIKYKKMIFQRSR